MGRNMTMDLKKYCLFLVFGCWLISFSHGKYVEGEINTLEDWQFITRFCFLSSKGTLTFSMEYPITYGPQHILLYFDTPDQWDAVYKSDKTCAAKVSVLEPENNQIIYLTTQYTLSGCDIKNIDGIDKYVCSGGRRFRSSRERWWYIAVSRCDRPDNSNCTQREAVMNPNNNQIIVLMPYATSSGCKSQTIDGIQKYNCTEERKFSSARERWWYVAVSHCQPKTPVGISLKYKIHMTNGEKDDYLHREYSADEFYILPIDITFLCLYIILSVFTVICAVLLRNRQLWHTTYKMFMVSVFLWTFHLFLMSIGYGIYGNDGLEWKLRATKYAARAFEALSILVFLLMLILMGKGYTITRGKLSMASTIKISVFMTIYTIVYIVIFVWEAVIFDPGLVLYVYESPPGYVLIAMRIIGFIWFCYAIFFTLKHYPEKGKFYYPLFVFYTLWFWAGPIVIIVAMTTIALWTREKTVAGVENFVALCGHVFFLILTRPQAANKNFPYHVRTTQIGIIEDAPHQLAGNALEGQQYEVSAPMASSSSGPDLTSLFTTSHTKSEKQKEAETPMNHVNGISNGPSLPQYNSFSQPRMVHPANRSRMNSSAHLIGNAEELDQVDEVPLEASAPPPSYEDMFRAQGNNGITFQTRGNNGDMFSAQGNNGYGQDSNGDAFHTRGSNIDMFRARGSMSQ